MTTALTGTLLFGQSSIRPLAFVLLCFALTFLISIILLYTTHWKQARGKVLIISRGKDRFSYGDENNPATFYKKDILDVTTIGAKIKGGYPRTAYVQISFTNGQRINISCLLITQIDLISKFPGCTCRTERKTIPLMPPDDPALF